MFAVIKTGGKQYRVKKDDVIRVEKLPGESGDAFAFDQVLMIGDESGAKAGAPLLDGASVQAEVVEQARGPKIIIFKKKRRKKYRRKRGHRQDLTVVRITEILEAGGAKTKAVATKKAAPAPEVPVTEAPVTEAPVVEEAAPAKKAAAKKKTAAPKKASGAKKKAAAKTKSAAAKGDES